jgi:outer membrane protein OmpA-like peptidoglycan-associated protein
MRRLCAIALLLAVAGCAQPQPPSPDAPRVVVFFQMWSAAIDDPAQAAIMQAAANAKAHPEQRVVVIGFADSATGSPAANVDISETRAQVVADALVDNGVAPGRITINARGATDFALNPTESRRVEVVVAP